ncbi:MAG TPA: phosphatidate cytidylyltransferase [Candidatus Nitrosotalea sp.]|nr:phosphatidate cytidylyltransferase [Candidatus Nitrosotalea sp.]
MSTGSEPVVDKPERDLRVRILTAAGLLAILLGLLYAGPLGVWLLVMIAGGLALFEFRGLSGRMGYRAPLWILYPLGAYFAFSSTVLAGISVEAVLSLTLIAGLTAFLFLPGRREGLGRWAMGLAGAVYIGLPFSYFLQLYALGLPRGREWVLFTILTVVVADTGALLVGARLGRTPFFPAISPRKTLEGALGGIVAGVVVMILGASLVLGLGLLYSASLGLLVGLSAVLGDLVESQMKRIARVKDASHLIPGHGGVLDRIDSLLFAPIVVIFFLSVTGQLH